MAEQCASLSSAQLTHHRQIEHLLQEGLQSSRTDSGRQWQLETVTAGSRIAGAEAQVPAEQWREKSTGRAAEPYCCCQVEDADVLWLSPSCKRPCGHA